MVKEKFIYLFGSKYSRMLSREKVARLFCPDDSDTSIADIQRDVQEIAFYIREKEKEECRLARLPLITEETSDNAPEYISAEKVQNYTNIIEELHSALFAVLPQLQVSRETSDRARIKKNIFERYRSIYDSALQSAIQYRILEQIKQLHYRSCKTMIEHYSSKANLEKVISIKQIQHDLSTEYDEKIAEAKHNSFQKISLFIKYTCPPTPLVEHFFHIDYFPVIRKPIIPKRKECTYSFFICHTSTPTISEPILPFEYDLDYDVDYYFSGIITKKSVGKK